MIGDIIIANVLTSACLVLLVYFFDINEKEPPWTLARIYMLSIIITFLFGKFEGFLFTRYAWKFSALVSNYVVAGFFEELLKFFVVMVFVWPLKCFNEEIDGIIYYLIVAAGFTVLENVGYSVQFVVNPYLNGLQIENVGAYEDALQKIGLSRAVSRHIFTSVVSGFFVGLAKMKHRWWLLVPGFFASVFLHGIWNQMAYMGYLGYFALGFLVLDVFLFVWTMRMSFYFKFLKRLWSRMKELIREAEEKSLDSDAIALMEGILLNLNVLRQMEGDVLVNRAKSIVQLLPSRVDAVSRNGEGGLIERLLKVNGILWRDRQEKEKGLLFKVLLMIWPFPLPPEGDPRYWIELFIGFVLLGFLGLMSLISLM